MAKRSALLDRVLPRLAPIGEPRGRAMFGGWGIYIDDVFMGLIAYDVLYFKVDDGNRADYEAVGVGPFTYTGHARPIEMSYWEVPSDVIADPDRLQAWATKALAAARRAKAARLAGRKRKTA
jgi:DNA transformation protein and related proteins